MDKGNRSRFLALGLAAAFVLALGLAAQTQSGDTAKDPVCGMMVKKDGAKFTADYKGTTYYFCSQSCRDAFTADPDKYLQKEADRPMGGGMQMRHDQGAQMKPGEMAGMCPFMLPDVERAVENTANGVVITLTSKNPETVKKLQEHAAMVKEGKCPMMMKQGVEKDAEAAGAAMVGGPRSGGCACSAGKTGK